jgi:hypothetical protein
LFKTLYAGDKQYGKTSNNTNDIDIAQVGGRPLVGAGSIDSGLIVTKIKLKVLSIILHTQKRLIMKIMKMSLRRTLKPKLTFSQD